MSASRHVHVAEDWAPAAVEWIRARVDEVLAAQDRVSLALSGGSSPAPVYAGLIPLLDWSRVDLYYGDERCVPPDHDDSTHKLVKGVLLDHVDAREFRMEGEDPDFDAAARRYEASLPERLDIAIQGMGPDGHTASLFPGHPGLDVTGRRVIHITDSPKPPPDRLTLTAEELRRARHTVVLAKGADKAPAIALALEGELDLHACPTQLLRDGAWFLDPAAASGLTAENEA